jgi:hypothetical protein
MKNEILKKAESALDEKDFKDFKKSIKNGDYDFIGTANYAKVVSTKDVLKSVYKGDCDMVVFNHYRQLVDLKKLVDAYESFLDEE